ncbi:unnamed protein product, partial [Callosobruchus maculatus]
MKLVLLIIQPAITCLLLYLKEGLAQQEKIIGGSSCKGIKHEFTVYIPIPFNDMDNGDNGPGRRLNDQNDPNDLVDMYLQICPFGGTLISDRWVLSSAICHLKPKFAIVGMSTSNANAYIKDHPESKIPVEKCINHEKASTSSSGEPIADYSIAVLKLSKAVSEGGTVSFVKLPTSKFSGEIHKSCPHGVIMGWGPISATGMFEKPRMTNSTNPDFPKPSPTMNCATVDVKPISECDGSLAKDRVMCTTSTAGKSASIFGDTGCPLMCNDVQVGIIVRMVMPGTPGTLYTRVDYYLDWINEHAFAEQHPANLIIVLVIISVHIVLHLVM